MTLSQLAKRVAITWFGVSWFAYFVLDVLSDNHGSRIGRAIVAGFFVALSTAPAYYWRLKSRSKSPTSGVPMLIALCALASSSAEAQRVGTMARADSQTIVFVCEHGTVKSVLALAYFTQMVREKNLSYRAISRGTAPDPALPAFMREGLRKDGLDIGSFTPTQLSESDLASAFKIVSFDQPSVAGLVAGRVPTLAWDNLPAVSDNYDVARDSIKQRVAALVDSLVRTRKR